MRRTLFPTITILLLATGSSPARVRAQDPQTIRASDPWLGWMGRVDTTTPERPRLGYPGVTLRLTFDAPSIGVRVAASSPGCFPRTREPTSKGASPPVWALVPGSRRERIDAPVGAADNPPTTPSQHPWSVASLGRLGWPGRDTGRYEVEAEPFRRRGERVRVWTNGGGQPK
jgi:hypothetical protein